MRKQPPEFTPSIPSPERGAGQGRLPWSELALPSRPSTVLLTSGESPGPCRSCPNTTSWESLLGQTQSLQTPWMVPPSTRLQHRKRDHTITAPGGVKPQRPPTPVSAVPDQRPGHSLTRIATCYPGPPETCRPPSFMDPVFVVKTLQSTRGPAALPGNPSHI